MKILKIAASAFLLSSVSAIAADLPSIKSAPAAAPTPMWTGFYAGLNAGATWGNNNNVHSTGTPSWNELHEGYLFWAGTVRDAAVWTGNLNTNNGLGFLGGGQIGYNYEIMNNFVVGLETDFQGTTSNTGNSPSLSNSISSTSRSVNLNQSVTSLTIATMQVSKSLNYIGTARGRVGYKIIPNLLIYGTGGLAYGGVSLSASGWDASDNEPTFKFPTWNTSSQILAGWTVGGGAEWMFMPNWSFKAEYLYYNLGNMTAVVGNSYHFWDDSQAYHVPGVSNGDLAHAARIEVSNHINGNIVRAGVNYHFNFASAPVVAKF